MSQEKLEHDLSVTNDTSLNFVSLPDKMAEGLKRFTGQVLIILSGNNDYVADEFKSLLQKSQLWQTLMARPSIKLQNYDEANHTFARNDWRQQVEVWTQEWVSKL